LKTKNFFFYCQITRHHESEAAFPESTILEKRHTASISHPQQRKNGRSNPQDEPLTPERARGFLPVSSTHRVVPGAEQTP